MKRRTRTALFALALVCPLTVGAAPRTVGTTAPARVERPDKPTGPIVVEHRLTAQPAVGVPLTIALTARVEGDVGRLSIEANATAPGALLVSPPLLVAVAGGVYTWEITAVPLAAEAGYLSIIVSGLIDGVAQARSVTIALRSTAPAEAVAVTIGEDERLIALPAQESP
jgi:hypothetical protein